jgi:16S rRNA (guanine527-N7)-methyltransferase
MTDDDPNQSAIGDSQPAILSDDTLEKALARHGLSLPADRIALVDQYCRLLWEWNEKLNLTRHTDYERFVARDLVDTLEVSKLIHPHEEVLEIGSGGGVPGLLLAILRPDLQVTLTESIGKKAKALAEITRRLKVKVRVEATRAEKLLAQERFDATLARGIGPLWKILSWLKPHWLSVGRLLAIKGPKWSEERGEARHKGFLNDLELRKAASYPLSGTNSESVILKIWPSGATER